jgi:hypothetical protein
MNTVFAKLNIRALIKILVALAIVIAAVSKVNAEMGPSVNIWNGITGYGNTYGTSGNPGGAYSYSATTDNIYYQEAYEIEWGTTDYLHQLGSSRTYYYYKNITPQAFVS